MTPQYAAAFEAKELDTSKKLIEALWRAEREKQRETRLRERMDPFLFTQDQVFKVILAGIDQQHPPIEGKNSSLKSYQDQRNIYLKNNLPAAQQLVDYLEYEDLLRYLNFFKENSIEASIDYGDKLARSYVNNQKARMDGKPIPSYPPKYTYV